MSTSPYSLDLRKRIIEYILDGNSQQSASVLFKVSTSAINTWFLRYKNEGNFAPKKRPGARRKVNLSELKEYVSNNPDITLDLLSKKFAVSICTIHNNLKYLGYSYKKKPSPMWKLTKRREINTKKP